MATPHRPLGALAAAAARYRRADKARSDAHDAVVAEILAALKAGEAPTEVAAESPFTAAHVRKMARDAGIPPARPGLKPKRQG